jgi:hypothetical protein
MLTVKKALKKLHLDVERYKAAGMPVDRYYTDLIRDLEQLPGFLPVDSPRLREEPEEEALPITE